MTEISRRQFAFCALAIVAVVLLGGRALRAQGNAPGTPSEALSGEPLPSGGTTGGTDAVAVGEPDAEPASATVTVHVAGRVRHPGVYVLKTGARVDDALEQAGGPREGADLDALNLAAKVADGQQVLVARRGGVAAATTAGSVTGGSSGVPAPAGDAATPMGMAAAAPGAPVNINSATAEQLDALQGVGPAIAAKIVAYRTEHGPFASPDDLLQVSGIGPKTLDEMRAQVQV